MNHDEPVIPVIGDEGLKMRAWRTLMMFRQRNDWPDDPIGLTKHSGGELWVEEDGGTELRVVSHDEPPRAGRLPPPTSGGKIVTFWGNKLHGEEPYAGSRAVQIGYMPRN